MSFRAWVKYAFFGSSLIVSGCVSNDVAPSHPIILSENWENFDGLVAEPDLEIWWHSIPDPRLKRLIETSLSNNLTVEKSRLTLELVANQNELNLQNQASLVQTSFSLGSTGIRGVDRVTSSGSSVSVLYALDVWGNKLRSRQVDDINLRLSEVDLAQLKWLVTTEVAVQYWIAGAAAEKVKLLRENLISLDTDLSAVISRKNAGKAVDSDIDSIRILKENYSLQIKYLETQREYSRQQLKILIGGVDITFDVESTDSLYHRSPVLAISAPASVLDRRFDVSSARLALDAALIREQIALRSGYPDLQISANLSAGAESIGRILSNPVSFVGGALTTPYLSAKRAKLVSASAKIDLKIATATFRDRIVTALSEVEVRFVDAKQIEVAYRASSLRQNYADQELRKANLRHRIGRASLIEVRRAERDKRDSDSGSIDVALQDWINYIGTLRALGGPI